MTDSTDTDQVTSDGPASRTLDDARNGDRTGRRLVTGAFERESLPTGLPESGGGSLTRGDDT